MAIIATGGKIHWNYFLALEQDMQSSSRYVEFCEENMATYSIEFAHLLLAASSEVDVVAKKVCQILSPGSAHNNINQYRRTLRKKLASLAHLQIEIPRYGITLRPWINIAEDKNPEWWVSHNNVKHQRDEHFQEATLKNSLNAMAGLLCLVFHLYDFETKQKNPTANHKDTTSTLEPDSSLLRLPGDYYYDHYVG